jgi:predicted neutral ceramidase superfamily lipid hydrolase
MSHLPKVDSVAREPSGKFKTVYFFLVSFKVTWFGDFSPLVRLFRLFNLGCSLIIIYIDQILGGFLDGKSTILFFSKMVWAIIWAIFLQTHLVTLVSYSRIVMEARFSLGLAVFPVHKQKMSIHFPLNRFKKYSGLVFYNCIYKS